MFWFIVAQIFSFVLDVVALRAQSDRKKDLEIRLVRQQLCIVERKQVQQCRLFTSLAVADANGLPYYGDDNELPEGWQYTSDE